MSEQILQAPEIEAQEDSFFPVFFAKKAEALCALLIYVPAYAYVCGSGISDPVNLTVVAAFLLLITEILNRGVKRSAESNVWLCCFALCTLSSIFCTGQVWEEYQKHLFIHIFAVWWIISRSGKLLEGKSGHFLPLDGLNAFIIIPFSHILLRIRCLIYGARYLLPKSKEDEEGRSVVFPIAAGALCLGLFAMAASLLTRADSIFGDNIRDLLDAITVNLDQDFLFTATLSLPVGAWLFGLTAGCARTKDQWLEGEKNGVMSLLERIQKIRTPFWIAVISVFSLLYLSFFILQGTYLFGAFTRTLPEGFIVSQYAREGFFELCKVCAVNFTVLWIVTRMAVPGSEKSRAFISVCLVFLAESMLFAVIAFSKLCLYISCFGFTPLRLQSSWLVCVLFAGCLCWAYTLVTDKPVFRKWMYFSAATLVVLNFV